MGDRLELAVQVVIAHQGPVDPVGESLLEHPERENMKLA